MLRFINDSSIQRIPESLALRFGTFICFSERGGELLSLADAPQMVWSSTQGIMIFMFFGCNITIQGKGLSQPMDEILFVYIIYPSYSSINGLSQSMIINVLYIYEITPPYYPVCMIISQSLGIIIPMLIYPNELNELKLQFRLLEYETSTLWEPSWTRGTCGAMSIGSLFRALYLGEIHHRATKEMSPSIVTKPNSWLVVSNIFYFP